MDIPKIKKMVAEAYAPNEDDNVIPKFFTQFVFTENAGILIRIPFSECGSTPPPLLNLIWRVALEAVPGLKRSEGEIRQEILAFYEGNTDSLEGAGGKYLVRASAVQISEDRGGTIRAVTECQIMVAK